jgi:hypothetical protein
MKRHVFSAAAVLSTFALGVVFAAALKGHEPSWLMWLGVAAPGAMTLGMAAVCYRQSLRGERGLRRSVAYNMLMFSAAALLFTVGVILSFITLVFIF